LGPKENSEASLQGSEHMILICLGSFLFTTFSIHISGASSDRIASNIVTGIGFIGGGVIFQSDNRINGITTAATIWAVAALGMGIADGAYTLVIVCTVIVMASLLLLTKLEDLIDRINQSHTYKIVSVYKDDLLKEYERLFEECNLRYKRVKRTKNGDYIIGTWLVHGSEKNHNRFTKQILHDSSVKEFEF
jgi:putative Mg2+ transporter-C (MgtC) family protein